MVVGLRHTLHLAKQISALDQLSGGRFTLGVGAGWLLEEFEALSVSTTERGQRLDKWLNTLRQAWTGALDPFAGKHFSLDRAVHMSPTPAHEIPFLVGGASVAAFRRIARHHAGWVAEFKASDDPAAGISQGVQRIHEQAERLDSPITEPLRVL